MSSPPTPSLPPPSWARHLLWSPTPPFTLDWRTIAHCPFSKTGHLKNRLNDDQAVLIGRDGQEVDGVCGRGLCGVIDGLGGVGGGV